jgi:hypothetical protein
MSVNAYGRVAGVDHAAVDALDDTAIQPDPGSINPYLAGADRYAANRSYTLTMTDGVASQEPNIIDAPPTNEAAQELIYRVYLPDRAADQAPASLPEPVLTLSDGQVLRGDALCAAINDPQRYFSFQTMPGPVYTGLVNLPGADPAKNPSYSPVRWEKFFNQPLALSVYRIGTPTAKDRRKDLALGEIGGFYDNRSVKYAVGPINAAYGKVLVLRGKLPTTPTTGPKVRTMGSGQMRYWSICQNGSPVATNGVDCVSERGSQARPAEGPPLHHRGEPQGRPAQERQGEVRCGVAELGGQEGLAGPADGHPAAAQPRDRSEFHPRPAERGCG